MPISKTTKGVILSVIATVIAAAVLGGSNEVIKAFKNKANADDVAIIAESLKESQEKDRVFTKEQLEAERKLVEEKLKAQRVLEDERHKAQKIENERRYEQQRDLSKSYSELLKILSEK